MAINISESTFRKTLEYLTNQAQNGDRLAEELLSLWQGLIYEPILDFDKRLFAAWKELTGLQVGNSCWSYPISFVDLAQSLSIPIENFIQNLELTEIDSLQLLRGRGENYLIKFQEVGNLAFHSVPNFSKLMYMIQKPQVASFKVGDRIRVNANRPQYTNQLGIVEQVISVSCRIKLDNGWIAFLPNHCLEKL